MRGAILCGVVLLRFVIGDAEADEAKSFTGCALTVASPDDLELDLPCEYGIFGTFSPGITAEVVRASGDGLACDALDPEVVGLQPVLRSPLLITRLPGPTGCQVVTGKILVADRGVCPMSLKAWRAQEAGAVAFVCIHTAEGARPVRMVHAGNEPNMTTIPAVMVSKEAGNQLKAHVAAQALSLLLTHDQTKLSPPMEKEIHLKKAAWNPSNDTWYAEGLMRLGEFYAQMNFTADADVMLNQAALVGGHGDMNILYAVGVYYWNHRKLFEKAGYYFMHTIHACMAVLETPKSRKIQSEALEVVKNTAALIPEDKPQMIAVRTLAHRGQWATLTELLLHLHAKGRLGTVAVSTWGAEIAHIRNHEKVLQMMVDFFKSHPMKETDDWKNAMRPAYAEAMASCKDAVGKACEKYVVTFDEEADEAPPPAAGSGSGDKKAKKKKIYSQEL